MSPGSRQLVCIATATVTETTAAVVLGHTAADANRRCRKSLAYAKTGRDAVGLVRVV